MKNIFEFGSFFREALGFKDDSKNENKTSNQNTTMRSKTRNMQVMYSGDSVIFAYSSKREEYSYPVHTFVNNSANLIGLNLNNNRLSPLSESCASSIIGTEHDNEHVDIILDDDFIDSTDSFDLYDIETFDSKAFKRVIGPLEILEEFFSKPRTFSISKECSEKVYVVKIPSEILKNSVMNYCSKNLTQIIPSSFYELKSLTTLQLCCNSITELAPEICLLGRLETLSLSNNKLKSIPSTIGYLTNLENLYLDRNELTTLPRSISGLKRLKILSLAANEFREIPRCVMQLTRLITLECDRNPNLIGVPSEIARFSQLGRFHVEDCPKLLKPEDYQTFQSGNTSKGTPSLLECSARSLIRHRKPVLNAIPRHLKMFLSKSEECSYCSGPMIESGAVHCRTIKRIDRPFPVIEKLCCLHWGDEGERIIKIFSSSPQTTPPHLIGVDCRNRTGPLSPFNQFDPERLAKGHRILSKFDRQDLGRVLVPLSMIVDWPHYPIKM